MKYEELVKSTIKVLINKRNHFKRELFNLRVQKVLNTLKNTARIKHIKKNVARIHCILKQKKKT